MPSLSFFNPARNFFREDSYLAVDIGTASVKIVELENSKGKPLLKNYALLETSGHLERLNDAIQTSSLKIVDKETVGLVKVLLKEMKTKARSVIASLPAFSAFTALLDIPVMSTKEISQALQYQAGNFVPLPLTEVTIDWLRVKEFEDEKGVKKQRLFLVAVPNEQIKRYQNIFRLAGLNLQVLEIETLSLARILTRDDPTTTLIVDIGARSTAIAIADGGFLKYSSQTDFAGGFLTQTITNGLGINIRRAEELKRRRGLLGTGGEYEISTLMIPYLDVILGEVRRVKNLYEKNYQEKVERIILAGGGANLLGLEKYVADEFKLPALKASPFSKVGYPPVMTPLVGSLGAPLAVSIGLGIRQI
ncbi:MAG: type IV pilus assembly protein PilM [Candidatus Colwellbacteria bacterium]|nr:type IV pilus assembly protein PilM [Candidatus Colwellbacteria bacterium]